MLVGDEKCSGCAVVGFCCESFQIGYWKVYRVAAPFLPPLLQMIEEIMSL